MSITRVRLERLHDERARVEQNIEDMLKKAEADDGRDLNELEVEQAETWRARIAALDTEIEALADDLKRSEQARDVSKLIRVSEPAPVVVSADPQGPVVYRTFSAYAQDRIITEYPQIAALVNGPEHAARVREEALERLQRTIENTLSSDVAGLLPPQHMAQIMDLINTGRPVVRTARAVDLARGSLTYPKIGQRPEVAKQSSEKTEGGTAGMTVTLESISADTYIGGGDISWQAIQWSTPDALQLWFDMAAEAYAMQTETAACASLEAAASGTLSPSLGTAGTEDYGDWRSAVIGAVASIYSTTSGRARTNTLYLEAGEFFDLATIATDQVLNLSAVGNLDIETLTGTFCGLRVVGSYGFQAGTRIVGDGSAFLVGENPGAPVEMRAVEPAIGGMEVGLIGAFQSVVFDDDRFLFLS